MFVKNKIAFLNFEVRKQKHLIHLFTQFKSWLAILPFLNLAQRYFSMFPLVVNLQELLNSS